MSQAYISKTLREHISIQAKDREFNNFHISSVTCRPSNGEVAYAMHKT